MKSLVVCLIRQYLFWMAFFALLRIVFLVYQLPLIRLEGIPAGEVLSTFWHALILDTSAACYLLALPMIMLTLQGLFSWPLMNIVNKVYTFLVIMLYSLVTAAELELYPEWKSKLNAKALGNLHHPAEAVQSIPAGLFALLSLIFIGLTIVAFISYIRVFYPDIRRKASHFLWPVLFLLIFAPLVFIGIRGGVKEIPITQSAAHFSAFPILNWASVNSGTNLAVSIMESRKYDNVNPFRFYDPQEARETVAKLHQPGIDTTISILKIPRPNIVILLLESWSADLVESLGGKPGITPEFAKLEQDGLLFTHFYASGNRSQQAMATIFGGFPALPYTTITENPDKYSHLPSLVKILESAGYHSSFFFGGQLTYGNIKAYLLSAGFGDITEEKDIDASVPRGRLGVHDGFLLDLHIREAGKLPEPFLSAVFTLSSHSPYDQPMEPVIKWGTNEDPFLNSAYYTDQCLGRYFKEARSEPWYANTLFIILADHSHNTYRNWPLATFDYHRIPLLLYGDVLKDEWKGKQMDRISSNNDIAVTLMAQIGLGREVFQWGNDLFNPYSPEFAFFEINDGVGWKTPDGEFVYHLKSDRYYELRYREGLPEEHRVLLIRDGKSYIQSVFQSFLDM